MGASVNATRNAPSSAEVGTRLRPNTATSHAKTSLSVNNNGFD